MGLKNRHYCQSPNRQKTTSSDSLRLIMWCYYLGLERRCPMKFRAPFYQSLFNRRRHERPIPFSACTTIFSQLNSVFHQLAISCNKMRLVNHVSEESLDWRWTRVDWSGFWVWRRFCRHTVTLTCTLTLPLSRPRVNNQWDSLECQRFGDIISDVFDISFQTL